MWKIMARLLLASIVIFLNFLSFGYAQGLSPAFSPGSRGAYEIFANEIAKANEKDTRNRLQLGEFKPNCIGTTGYLTSEVKLTKTIDSKTMIVVCNNRLFWIKGIATKNYKFKQIFSISEEFKITGLKNLKSIRVPQTTRQSSFAKPGARDFIPNDSVPMLEPTNLPSPVLVKVK